MNDNTDKELWFQFKEAREKKSLSQANVAKQSGMTVTYYAMIERGEANPTWNKLKKLSKVLGLKFSIKTQ